MNLPIGSYFAVYFLSYIHRYFLLVEVLVGGCPKFMCVCKMFLERHPRVFVLHGFPGVQYGTNSAENCVGQRSFTQIC
jgi:hypothetical protein